MEIKLEKTDGSNYFLSTKNGKEIGHFILDIDGSYYFVMLENCSAYWAAHTLKEVAKLLDDVNEPFNKQVIDFFEQERRDMEEQARVEYRGLMNSGMMFEFYPHLTGVWKNDKNTWLELPRLRAKKDSF